MTHILNIVITVEVDDVSVGAQQKWHNWVSNVMGCPAVAGCGCTFAKAVTSWPERPASYDADIAQSLSEITPRFGITQ